MKTLTNHFSLKSIKTVLYTLLLVVLVSYSDLYAGCTIPPVPTVSPETNTTCTGTCFNFASGGGSSTSLILQYDDNAAFTSPTQVVHATSTTSECISDAPSTIINPGTTIYWRIRAVDCTGPCDCFSDYAYGDSILIPFCASVANLSLEEVILYPNPTTDRIYIKNMDQSAIDLILIYDQTGRKIGEWKPHAIDYFDVSNLNNGFYISIINTKQGKFSEIISINH